MNGDRSLLLWYIAPPSAHLPRLDPASPDITGVSFVPFLQTKSQYKVAGGWCPVFLLKRLISGFSGIAP
jgi:hypothetical protein